MKKIVDLFTEASLADAPVSWLKTKYKQLSNKANRSATEDNVLRQIKDALKKNDVDHTKL